MLNREVKHTAPNAVCQPAKPGRVDMTAQTSKAFCPSCGCYADFTLIGEQRWPQRVAAAAGIPEVVGLWNCSVCESTISEIDLFS